MIVLKSVRTVASMAPPLKKIDDFVKPVFDRCLEGKEKKNHLNLEKQLFTHGIRSLK